MSRINAVILILILMMGAAGTVQPKDMRPELTRDYKFWRGPYEKTPGPFLCIKPDAVDVWVTCNRWPDTSDLRKFSQDAIRLSKAETDHDRALAVWQWMRRVKSQTNGQAPLDPFQPDRGDDRVNCPIKIFNVHGAHWCSGLGRVTALLWRALGRQGRCVHRASHGMAGLRYKDNDGMKRWHLFDCNFGGFTLDRSHKRVLGMNEFSTDLYMWMHIWYFGEPWPMPIHRMELKFRKGESLKRIWGNWGKPFHNNISASKDRGTRKPFEKGPYPVEFGNGLWTYTPDLASKDWTDGLAEPLKCMAAGKLEPAAAGTPGTAVWHFRTPYHAVESEIDIKAFRRTGGDTITLSLSVDNGKTWRECWSAPADSTGEQAFTVKVDQKFEVKPRRMKIPKDLNSPFGRYAFRYKLTLNAKSTPSDCRVNGITFKTIVHQSIRALPQLWPGKNTITVRGSLEKGSAVRVTYVWDDPKGKGRKNVTVAEKLPYTYEILAAGGKWEDVICKDLIVDTIPADNKGSRTEVKEEPSPVQELPPMPTPYKSRCRWGRPEKRKAYSIEKCIAIIEGKEKGSARRALQWISELGDPKGFAAAKKAAYDKDLCKHKGVKLAAIFAIFNSDREKAREALKAIAMDVKNSPWRGGDNMKYAGGAWGAGAAHIALMAAEAGWADYGPVLAKALESKYMGDGNSRAIMRSLAHIGQPGDEKVAAAIRKVLKSGGVYTTVQAARAAGAVKDKKAVPRLRELLDHPFMEVRHKAAVALGRIGDTESAPKFRESLFRIRNWKILDHHKYGTEIWEDEYMRGAAAEALGLMKDKGSLPDLKKALKNEPVEWVRKKIQEAISRIE